jgi:hypothetical protein
MDEITTIGIDLAKNIQVHGVDARSLWWSVKRCAAFRFCASSRLCRGALSAWRRALRRTTGRARLQRWAMRFEDRREDVAGSDQQSRRRVYSRREAREQNR